jgi:hypothetical protein
MSTMTGVHPYENSLPDWWQGERDRAAQVAEQPGHADQVTLARVLAGLRRDDEPTYAETMRAHYATGPQPTFTPNPAAEDAAQAVAARAQQLLRRSVAALAGNVAPMFQSRCWDCIRAGGWCDRHTAMRQECMALLRIADEIELAPTYEDAWRVFTAGACDEAIREERR